MLYRRTGEGAVFVNYVLQVRSYCEAIFSSRLAHGDGASLYIAATKLSCAIWWEKPGMGHRGSTPIRLYDGYRKFKTSVRGVW